MPSLALDISLRGLLLSGTKFSPISLFASSEPGVWYDPSDLTTLFQDSAGTTPVTAAGQPVGLVLDKSQGLVLGPNIATVSSVTGVAIGGPATTSYDISPVMVAGRAYEISFTISGYSGSGTVGLSGNASSYTPVVPFSISSLSGNGTVRVIAISSSSVVPVRLYTQSTNTANFSNISVRELPGNHATQSTAASRPTYGVVPSRGRVNLLTFSEAFDNAAWNKSAGGTGLVPVVTQNAALAPDGTMTADQVVFDAGGGTTNTNWSLLNQTATTEAVTYTGSVWLRTLTGTATIVTRNAATSTYGSIVVSTEWQRFSRTELGAAGTGDRFSLGIRQGLAGIGTINASATVLIWGAQLETGSTATTYQRVVSQFDVTDPVGFPSYPLHYLFFDGVDDFLVTPTITPNADKVQVFAGVRKLSDAATAALAEFSTSGGNGRWLLSAPRSAGANYGFQSVGSLISDPTASGFAAPITNVLTALGDISGDLATLRVNGTQAAQSTTDQGTGNYNSNILYIGRRGGTSLAFNGQLYGLITRFGANLIAEQIAAIESWMNQKTGAY